MNQVRYALVCIGLLTFIELLSRFIGLDLESAFIKSGDEWIYKLSFYIFCLFFLASGLTKYKLFKANFFYSIFIVFLSGYILSIFSYVVMFLFASIGDYSIITNLNVHGLFNLIKVCLGFSFVLASWLKLLIVFIIVKFCYLIPGAVVPPVVDSMQDEK